MKNTTNKKKDHKRLRSVIAGIVAAESLVFVGISAIYLDGKMNDNAILSDTYPVQNANLSYARGSVTLDDIVYNYYHNYENYLFIGTDESGNEDGEGTAFQNAMADYLMLLSIDKSAKTYSIIELNRDTMTDIHVLDDQGNDFDTLVMQLCTAHYYGNTKERGAENQVRAVSDLMGGMRINGYVVLSIKDLEKLNHAIGGVTLTLTEDFTDVDPAMTKGRTMRLSDQQAYYYLRRRMDVADGTNENRMERQHQYITAFLDQGMQKLSSSPNYFYDVLETMETLTTTNLTGKQYSKIAKALTKNTQKGIVTFEGEAEIGESLGDDIPHSEFYVDEDSLLQVLTDTFGLVKDHDAMVETESEEPDEEESEELYSLFEAESETEELTEGLSESASEGFSVTEQL